MTAVPLNAPSSCCLKSKMYSELTSFPQWTSRGLPHAFFFFLKKRGNKDQREKLVSQNQRANRSSQHCGKRDGKVVGVWTGVSWVSGGGKGEGSSAFPSSLAGRAAKWAVSRGNDRACDCGCAVSKGTSEITLMHWDTYERTCTHTPSHTSRRKHTTPVTAPFRNGYFFTT